MNSGSANTWKPSDIVYCTNVHPAETLQEINTIVHTFIHAVAQQRSLKTMSCGLWLNGKICSQLQRSPNQRKIYQSLFNNQNGSNASLFTLNGFPYGDFHSPVVKEKVYLPSWSNPKRLEYTIQLSTLLAECSTDDMAEGTISTLPLGYAPDWDNQKHQLALQQLCTLVLHLDELFQQTGKHIRVCLEAEPGCVLETSDQMINLFLTELPQAAEQCALDTKLIHRYLGVCYDVCHQAVMFEDIKHSLTRISDANIVIGKIQLSNALHVNDPTACLEQLEQYAEPKYLHQVRCQLPRGHLSGKMDLRDAIDDNNYPKQHPWRIHFHVPIHTQELEHDALSTTQAAITDVLDFLAARPKIHPHLEVETYTWHVLPQSLQPTDSASLIKGLALELNWVEAQMQKRGMLANEK
jgi:hypothetical protein